MLVCVVFVAFACLRLSCRCVAVVICQRTWCFCVSPIYCLVVFLLDVAMPFSGSDVSTDWKPWSTWSPLCALRTQCYRRLGVIRWRQRASQLTFGELIPEEHFDVVPQLGKLDDKVLSTESHVMSRGLSHGCLQFGCSCVSCRCPRPSSSVVSAARWSTDGRSSVKM